MDRLVHQHCPLPRVLRNIVSGYAAGPVTKRELLEMMRAARRVGGDVAALPRTVGTRGVADTAAEEYALWATDQCIIAAMRGEGSWSHYPNLHTPLCMLRLRSGDATQWNHFLGMLPSRLGRDYKVIPYSGAPGQMRGCRVTRQWCR